MKAESKPVYAEFVNWPAKRVESKSVPLAVPFIANDLLREVAAQSPPGPEFWEEPFTDPFEPELPDG